MFIKQFADYNKPGGLFQNITNSTALDFANHAAVVPVSGVTCNGVLHKLPVTGELGTVSGLCDGVIKAGKNGPIQRSGTRLARVRQGGTAIVIGDVLVATNAQDHLTRSAVDSPTGGFFKALQATGTGAADVALWVEIKCG